MRFRPCIDLHEGKVKQIVGSSFSEIPGKTRENFVSEKSPAHYAKLYRRDALKGGHVILLGGGNKEAALEALAAYPNGLGVGGGVNEANAPFWLENGAEKVILTSHVISEGEVHWEKLRRLAEKLTPEKITLDLSCAERGGDYLVMSDRWTRQTRVKISAANLRELSGFCSEFLIHAVNSEGKNQGPDLKLVALLADLSPIPITYAGGIRSPEDVAEVGRAGKERVDFTVGSSLDLFGGSGVKYANLILSHP